MTRERAKKLAPIIAAFGEGRPIQNRRRGLALQGWNDIDTDEAPEFSEAFEYRIKPEPKRRPMTRAEVLGFVAWNPHIVVRMCGYIRWAPAQQVSFDENSESYEWAEITESGQIGEPHKFEIDE